MDLGKILPGVGVACALLALGFVDENVLDGVEGISCTSAPLAATAAMIFTGGSTDPKSIVGYVYCAEILPKS